MNDAYAALRGADAELEHAGGMVVAGDSAGEAAEQVAPRMRGAIANARTTA